MKTAKKTLCLVLVVVMALGLIPFSSAVDASTFADIADVDTGSLEALYVLAGIGVIEGDQGKFEPKNHMNREQAAKIIAYLLMGPSAANLPKSATQFSDVPASEWSSGFIAYCAAQGLIVGDGLGKFNPKSDVTNAQFCIMLLRALGFAKVDPDTGKDQYTGTGWDMRAYVDATKSDANNGPLFSIDTDFNAPALREQMVVFAFNAIIRSSDTKLVTEKRYLVSATATASSLDSYTGTTVFVGGRFNSIDEVMTAASDVSKELTVSLGKPVSLQIGKDYTVTEINVTVKEPVKQIAKDVYGLKQDPKSADDLGRPGHYRWIYNKKVVYDSEELGVQINPPIKTYSADFYQADLYKLTDLGANAPETIPAVYNSSTKTSLTTLTADRTQTFYSADLAGGRLGNGVITEIYQTFDGGYQAVIIAPAFGKVTDVKNTAGFGTASYTTYYVSKANSGDDAQYGRVYTTHVTPEFEKDTATVNGDVKKGDYVLYYIGTSGHLYIESLSTVSGVISAITSAGVITLNGATANYAKAVGNIGLAVNDKERDFYVDSFGYILAEKDNENVIAKLNYYFVLGVDRIATLDGNKVNYSYEARVVDMGGNELSIPTTSGMYSAAATISGKLCSYNTTSTVFTVNTTTNADKAVATIVEGNGAGSTITTGSTRLATLTSADNVYLANGQTQFVYVTYDSSYNITGIKVYAGVDNVPTYTMKAVAGGRPTQIAYAVSVKTATAAPDKVANIVFIVGAPGDETALGVVYYLGSYTDIGGNKYTFDVIKDGKRETLTASNVDLLKSLSSGELMFGGLLFDFQIEDGIVKGWPASTLQNGFYYDMSAGGLVFLPASATVRDTVQAETASIAITGGLIYYGAGSSLNAITGANGDRIKADTNIYQFTQIFNTYTQEKGTTDLDKITFPAGTYGPDGAAYVVYNNAAHDSVLAVYIILPSA